jgi:hypothetical protein
MYAEFVASGAPQDDGSDSKNLTESESIKQDLRRDKRLSIKRKNTLGGGSESSRRKK